MSAVFGVLTSDPNLMACQLARLSAAVALGPSGANVRGLGFSSSGELLMERLPSRQAPPQAGRLLPEGVSAEALLFHSGALPIGLSLDENTQPFRGRGFLFAHHGQQLTAARVRAALAADLPSHLLAQIQGETGAEVAFAMFLSRLKSGDGLTARSASEALRQVAQKLNQVASDPRSTTSLVATNGQLLVAARVGPAPLHYALLEGLGRCEVCELKAGTPDQNPAVREHLRARTVAVASSLSEGAAGFIELADGAALAVDVTARVELLAPQA